MDLPHGDNVPSFNLQDTVSFVAQDTGVNDNKGLEKMLRHVCPAREELCLKIGAQVVLIKNIDPDTGLVNGARGIVTNFSKQMGLPVVR